MALKDTWTPKIDDVDDVMASDINEVAAAVIKIEEEGVSGGGGGGMTEEQVREILAGQIDVGYLTVSSNGRITTPAIYISDGVPDWRGLVQYDGSGREITMEQTLATLATKKEVGEISAVLDELHTYAQSLIGGGESE